MEVTTLHSGASELIACLNDQELSGIELSFDPRDWRACAVSVQTPPSLITGLGKAKGAWKIEHTGNDFVRSSRYIGKYSARARSSGVFTASDTQKITSQLAIEFDAAWQLPIGGIASLFTLSYEARYKAQPWSASARLLSHSSVQMGFGLRLTDYIEAGANINWPLTVSGDHGTVAFGAKYSLARSSLRAYIDSQGMLRGGLKMLIAAGLLVILDAKFDSVKVSHEAHLRAIAGWISAYDSTAILESSLGCVHRRYPGEQALETSD